MKILAFIPARSGSKRIPNKNLALLNDKPLISYTIQAAKASKKINRVVVSTDSPEIARISRHFGAEVPFLRPRNIANSASTEMQFFRHALSWFKRNENYIPDLIVLLYPTAPFRKPESIDKAVAKIMKCPEADSLRSVKSCSEHPYKMWTLSNGYLKPFVKTKLRNAHTLSYSLLPEVYVQNANIYITRPATILGKKSPTGDIIIPFIMDAMESVDINNPVDLLFAKSIYIHLKSQRRLK